MTFYEKELKKIFGDSMLLSADTVSFGKTMMSKIGEDLRAKIEFVTSGHANHYDALKVSIIKRNEGVVDEQRFNFSDIIGIQDGVSPHVWEYNASDIKWYGYTPNRKAISAVSVTSLFRSLANIFQSKIDDNNGNKIPVIDRRQRREIEEKRNAEIGFV